MNWDWASSLDQIWRSPTFPMWLTLAAAGFFGTHRSDHAVARGEIRGQWRADGHHAARDRRRRRRDHPRLRAGWRRSRRAETRPALRSARRCRSSPASTISPAMPCSTPARRRCSGPPNSVAAAVTYAASQITRLTGLGDARHGRQGDSSDLQALRRAVERDRYGLMAYVLMARDHCTPAVVRGVRARWPTSARSSPTWMSASTKT